MKNFKILVTGGTGKVGSEVVKELRERGASVRVLVRKKKPSGNCPEGVEVVVGDLLDPVSVQKALEGMDKLYLLNGVVADELTQGLIAYGLARKNKLQHVVYHSVFKVDQFKDVAHFASKIAIENALRQFEIPFTIIRPNYFMQNDLSLKASLMGPGVYPIPLGTPGISVVDIRDIAEAAAIALTTEGHHGKTYNLNGPSLLSGARAAAIWSEVLEKEISYAGEALDPWEEQMRQEVPAWMAYDMRMMFQGYLEHGFAAEAGDVETLTKLLGHAPRSYDDFARDAAREWIGEAALAAK
jgi:uncharacterized protein YbjT (DUF2867 family)